MSKTDLVKKNNKVRVICNWCSYSYIAYNIDSNTLKRLLYEEDLRCENCNNTINVDIQDITGDKKNE